MRKSISVAAIAVLCLASSFTAATAGAPIRGIVVKGGQNPGGNCPKLPCSASDVKRTANPNMPGDTDGNGAHAQGKGSALQGFHYVNRTTATGGGDSGGGSTAGNGVTQEHAADAKGGIPARTRPIYGQRAGFMWQGMSGRTTAPNGTGAGGGAANTPNKKHVGNIKWNAKAGHNGSGSTDGNGATQDNAINTKGTGSTNRTPVTPQ